MRSFKQVGNRLMPNEKVNGFHGNVNKYYQNRSLGMWLVIYIRSQVRGTIFENKDVQESQVLIMWNCGLWGHHVG